MFSSLEIFWALDFVLKLHELLLLVHSINASVPTMQKLNLYIIFIMVYIEFLLSPAYERIRLEISLLIYESHVVMQENKF